MSAGRCHNLVYRCHFSNTLGVVYQAVGPQQVHIDIECPADTEIRRPITVPRCRCLAAISLGQQFVGDNTEGHGSCNGLIVLGIDGTVHLPDKGLGDRKVQQLNQHPRATSVTLGIYSALCLPLPLHLHIAPCCRNSTGTSGHLHQRTENLIHRVERVHSRGTESSLLSASAAFFRCTRDLAIRARRLGISMQTLDQQ